ncbi:MAG: hypothetical protein KF799_07650 [Bdellovibrionales bacterium]|nr:hypothetical protein [Bdellovibrionales bacterium]
MVSTTLIIPLPTLAEQAEAKKARAPLFGLMASPLKEEAVDAKSGVVLQKYNVNGEELHVTMATVEPEQEADTLLELAQRDPENTIVGATGSEDPALAKVKRTGFFSRLKTIILGKVDDIPVLKDESVPKKTRQIVTSKVKTFGRNLKDNPLGVIFTVAYASGLSIFTYYQTSSVDAAVAQFIPTLFWTALLTIYTNKWFQYLDSSGKLAEKLASLAGRRLDGEKGREWNATGQFLGSLAANSMLALLTLYTSGGLYDGAAAIAQVAWYGMLLNSNVVDPTMLRWKREGKISDGFLKAYMPLMQLATASVEIATFFGVPFAGLALGTLVTVGLIYLLKGPSFERKVAMWKNHIVGKAKRTAVNVRARFGRAKDSCASFLKGPPAPPVDIDREEQLAWAMLMSAGY